MRIAHVSVEGIGMLSAGRAFEHEVDKAKKGHEIEWEKENFWRRMHYQDQEKGGGQIVVPALCCKKSLDEAVRRSNEKVRGSMATWTKYYEAGVMVFENAVTNKTRKDLIAETYFVDPRGSKSGKGGTRVWRCFPFIADWKAQVDYTVIEDKIDEKDFERHLTASGLLVGWLRFRPMNGGFCGRFKVAKITWEKA